MVLERLPAVAAWRHQGAREASEVVFCGADGSGTTPGTTLEGCTVGVEAGEPWVVDYRVVVDDRWRTRSAEVTSRSRAGRTTVRLEHDGHGRWWLDGVACPRLDGCLDVDLEASATTNTLPVHRFSLAADESGPVAAPAAFVRAASAEVERLEQSYRRLADGPDGPRFDYAAPVFDVRCVLTYDAAGLVLDYPGLAVRTAVALQTHPVGSEPSNLRG